MNTTSDVPLNSDGVVPVPLLQREAKRASTHALSRSLPFFVSDTCASRLLKQRLLTRCRDVDFQAVQLVEESRPPSLRQFDQIPMQPTSLLQQVHFIAPYLAGKSVAFVGDHDSTSLLLGLLAKKRRVPSPSKMLVLDFDERLLNAVARFATRHHLTDVLDIQLYNVFDPLPNHLVGQYNWYYTNPPYGCRNTGESARLFITRGCELVRGQDASGCIILPDDASRPWTRTAMLSTQDFLCQHGWAVDEKINQLHRYRLDDDQELASSVVIVKYDPAANHAPPMKYAGRSVDFSAISYFYGQSVVPPYPRYIRSDGQFEYW